MSEAKTTMNNNAENVERMGREMAVEARSRPRFVANAMAIWERAHPGRSLTDELQCDEHRLWRLAVTPQPTGAEMARQTM